MEPTTRTDRANSLLTVEGGGSVLLSDLLQPLELQAPQDQRLQLPSVYKRPLPEFLREHGYRLHKQTVTRDYAVVEFAVATLSGEINSDVFLRLAGTADVMRWIVPPEGYVFDRSQNVAYRDAVVSSDTGTTVGTVRREVRLGTQITLQYHRITEKVIQVQGDVTISTGNADVSDSLRFHILTQAMNLGDWYQVGEINGINASVEAELKRAFGVAGGTRLLIWVRAV